MYNARFETLEAQVKVCMAAVANSGTVQVPTTPKGKAPRPSFFYGARNVREIDNFLCELEAYFAAMGIKDDVEKVSNTTFSIKDIVLV